MTHIVRLSQPHLGLDVYNAFRDAILAESQKDKRQKWNPVLTRQSGGGRGCSAYCSVWYEPSRIMQGLFGARGKWVSQDVHINLLPLDYNAHISVVEIEVAYLVEVDMGGGARYGDSLEGFDFADYREAYDRIVARFIGSLEKQSSVAA